MIAKFILPIFYVLFVILAIALIGSLVVGIIKETIDDWRR